MALYLAKASQRINLCVTCGIRTMVGGGAAPVTLANIGVTNAGDRPVRIAAITLKHGFFKTRQGIIKIEQPTEYCESLLRVLNDGDVALFGFPIDEPRNWVSYLKREVRSPLELSSLRVTVHCTNGQKVRVKPEASLLAEIRKGMKEHRNKIG